MSCSVEKTKKEILIYNNTRSGIGRVYKDVEKYLSTDYSFTHYDFTDYKLDFIISLLEKYDIFITNICNIAHFANLSPMNLTKTIFSCNEFSEIEKLKNFSFPKEPVYSITSNSIQTLFPQNIQQQVIHAYAGVELSNFNYVKRNGNIDKLGWHGNPNFELDSSKWSIDISIKTNILLSFACRLSYNELKEWYNKIDVLLINSGPEYWKESGPLHAFEAIASGVLVIGTKVGNFSQIPGPKYATIDEAVEILLDLKQNPNKVRQIAEEQYECVKHKWTYNVLSEQWKRMYEQVTIIPRDHKISIEVSSRDIIILDCDEIKCPQVLLFVFKEFTGYFKRNNYNIKVVHNITELHDNSIVLMGDIFNCNDPVSLLNSIAPNAIYIGWYWHKINTDKLKYFIYTYENFLNIHYDTNRVDDLIKIRSFTNNTSFLLRADEDPLLVGTYNKDIHYDFCYMGWEYCKDLIPQNFKGIYHGVTDHAKFLDYETRKNIYLSSLFALGFQDQTNIYAQHVSQRIFEGLAYGCVVLSNSLPACEQTNNIVIHATSREEIEEIMTYYMNNPALIEKKQNEGYAFVKKFGTNKVAAQNFIDLIENKFSIII